MSVSLPRAGLVAKSSPVYHPAWLTCGLEIDNKIDLLRCLPRFRAEP
jgi:hypothetical protein